MITSNMSLYDMISYDLILYDRPPARSSTGAPSTTSPATRWRPRRSRWTTAEAEFRSQKGDREMIPMFWRLRRSPRGSGRTTSRGVSTSGKEIVALVWGRNFALYQAFV